MPARQKGPAIAEKIMIEMKPPQYSSKKWKHQVPGKSIYYDQTDAWEMPEHLIYFDTVDQKPIIETP